MHWDGYTIMSVVSGVALLTVAFVPSLGVRSRIGGVIAGLGIAGYGVYVASQTSSTYYFAAQIFIVPFLLVPLLIAVAVQNRRTAQQDEPGARPEIRTSAAVRKRADSPAREYRFSLSPCEARLTTLSLVLLAGLLALAAVGGMIALDLSQQGDSLKTLGTLVGLVLGGGLLALCAYLVVVPLDGDPHKSRRPRRSPAVFASPLTGRSPATNPAASSDQRLHVAGGHADG